MKIQRQAMRFRICGWLLTASFALGMGLCIGGAIANAEATAPTATPTNAIAAASPAGAALPADAQSATELLLQSPAQTFADATALQGLTQLQSLTVEGGALQNLNGLQALPALQSLTLRDCPAMDLSPLADCANLTRLTIVWSSPQASATCYDITPLTGCPKLADVTLTGPCVADLSPLAGFEKLTTLSVTDPAFTDASPIGRLTGLTGLRLYGLTAAQLTQAFTGRSRKLAAAYVGACDLTPDASRAILSQSRLKALGFSQVEGLDATAEGWAGLNELTSLQMDGGHLADLGFVSRYLTSAVVKLTDVRVGDGSALCTVDFDKYFITLKNVPDAQAVKLLAGEHRQWNYATLRMEQGTVGAQVIASLSGVEGLLSLDVQSPAADAFALETWRGFASLQQLKIADCGQTDLAMLTALPSLHRLALTRCTVQNGASLAQVRKLTNLSLTGCTVADWAFLDALTCGAYLTTLSIADCGGPASLAFVAALPKLETLALEAAGATDATPLAALTALRNLSLYDTPIRDYAPLATLAGLQRLSCNEAAALPELACRVDHRRLIALP